MVWRSPSQTMISANAQIQIRCVLWSWFVQTNVLVFCTNLDHQEVCYEVCKLHRATYGLLATRTRSDSSLVRRRRGVCLLNACICLFLQSNRFGITFESSHCEWKCFDLHPPCCSLYLCLHSTSFHQAVILSPCRTLQKGEQQLLFTYWYSKWINRYMFFHCRSSE